MAFALSRSVVVDHTKVAGDLVDFPFLFAGVYDFLATVANGGNVRSASGYDIGFFSDAALTTPLPFELVEYLGTTGQIECWVLLPTISASVDLVFYVAYDNPAISTDQSTPTVVWADYELVAHLPNGTSLTANDSTASPVNGTVNGAVAAAGQIGGGASFNGTSDNIQAVGNTKLSMITGDMTLSAWVKPTNVSPGHDQTILFNGGNASTTFGMTLLDATGKPEFYTAKGFGGAFTIVAGSPLTNGQWALLNGVYVETGSGSFSIYINTTATSKVAVGSGFTGTTLRIGERPGTGAGDEFFGGLIDEVRIIRVARSAEWIATEYANQSDAATFFSVGTDRSIAYLVTVAGVDRDPLLETFNISAPLNGISSMRADFDSDGSPPFRPDLDAEIVVREFGDKIFGGYITAIRERGFDGPNGLSIVVETTSADYRIATTRRYVTETITSGSPPTSPPSLTLRDVLEVLVPTYLAAYGITLDPAQVDGPDIDPSVTVYDSRVLKDILDELSILTGYIWDITVDKVFRMYAIGTIAAPFDVDETDLPARYFGDITVEPTRAQYANRLLLRYGPQGTVPIADVFVADGITNSYVLTAQIAGPLPGSMIGAVGYGYLLVSGSVNESESIGTPTVALNWDYVHATKTISRNLGILTAGDVIQVAYLADSPITIIEEDAGEIALHGLFEFAVWKELITNPAAASAFAISELARHLTVLRRITYTTRERDLAVGMTQMFTVPARDLSTTGVIVELVTESEPGGDILVRRVTALEGTIIQGDWRDLYRQWLGGAG